MSNGIAPGACISTNPSSVATSRLAVPRTAGSAKLSRKLYRTATKRKTIRVALLVSNVLILVGVAAFILHQPNAGGASQSAALQSASSSSAMLPTNPLDQVSSADIALTVARMSSLPESTAITNQAQSQAVTLATAVSNDTMTAKPQVVATTLKSSADIKAYTVVANDTVPSLSQKFGVTSDSIRWSNDLIGDVLTPGAKLTIPPVNGIVYTVAAGDTVDTLAAKFSANKDKIVAFNDAEINGLTAGAKVVIPDGVKASAAVSTAVARTGTTTSSSSSSATFPWGGSAVYGANGYDYGYCTWWVAGRRAQVGAPLPSNLGNASSWGYLGRLANLSEGSVPRQYAAAVTSTRGEGHVVFVEAVNADGSILISEMNHLGWNVKDTATVSADQASTYTYIY